jgi:hypothetical protein
MLWEKEKTTQNWFSYVGMEVDDFWDCQKARYLGFNLAAYLHMGKVSFDIVIRLL